MKTGFSRLCITPYQGIAIAGYYEKRFVKGTLDDLYVSAVSFDDGEKKAVQWVLSSKNEFYINFSAACRKEPDGMRWLEERDLEIFIHMALGIRVILDIQIKDQLFWYRWKH